ncbi:hypothetical protein ASZ78_016290 [Callipepla squamata]|uniref:Zinc finger ZZ-type and EF-hand domain-containing protein 1 n=1 Tax=Callipepla squamata TaxID=9009 RepID=A0A226NAX7_CALSU|nr:hypothetical protein ASZ78_016290 [Callipepla squamata]
MGTAASHSSEEEEEEGAEEGMEAAAQPGAPFPAAPLPPAEVLLEQARLREATARLREAALPEPLVSRHHGALVRWLEERLSRGDEAVSLEQFCEVLESASRVTAGARGESEEAFAQFDAEGDGTVDVENMLEALKNSSGANLQGELSHVIRQLQACSLVPGFIDIFSESKERLGLHAAMILRFLHRNRISSTAIPYPVLEYFNNICTMRSSVLKDSLDLLLLKEKEYPSDLNSNEELDKLKTVTKCYTHIETSSNSADIDKMTNGETTSFWQSDGSARSHWIRLKMKPDVVLRHLSIAVAANDQSYMPQQVTVAVGRNVCSLQEVRDVHIPSNITGYVTLLENANISQMYVQINIKRCLSDGCDTRIHGLRAIGYQRIKKMGVSVCDASAIWYWSLLTSLVTASMETNPAFVHTILQNTQKALQHMPPLSLTPSSTDFSSFLSPNVLQEVDSFLIRITSCCTTPDVELTLLAFALARGSVAKVISSLCTITDHLDTPYKASSLIASMATVRQNLLYKYGKPLRLTLQACDVKGKEDKSGPENLLVEPWTGDGFLTETGKTRASIILSTGTESSFQVTQIRIKVRRGAIGAQCGLVFAYNSPSEKFHAEEHFKRFESYDKWKLKEFRQFLKNRSSCSSELGDGDPIGWFEVDEEWDEVDVRMQQCRVAQVQQKECGLKCKSYLDFTDLDLQLFWNFYNKLHQNPREECIFAQTLLLQLLQSCFSVLTGDKTSKPQETLQNKTPSHTEAAEDLYRHLCEVVDMEDTDFMPVKMLKQEVKNTLLSGAAIFFPDRQTRRNQLFAMMKNITEQEHKQSVHLAFRSLCTYFSDQDPGGLLLLPEKGVSANFDISEVLSVMDTLLLVAARECEMMMLDVAQQESGTVLSSLFWSVQGSLLSWCYLQLKGSDNSAKDLAVEILKNYVGQFLTNIRMILQSLLSQYSGKMIVEKISNSVFAMATRQLCEMMMLDVAQQESGTVLSSLFWSVQGSLLSWCYLQLKGSDNSAKDLAVEILKNYVGQFLTNIRMILQSLLSQYSGKMIVEKISNSVFAMATRQLVIFLLDFCTLDIPYCTLLQEFSTLVEPLKKLCSEPHKMEIESWQQEQPVVLRTWTVESPHNYENNCHEVSVFLCHGATYFEVEFDEKCETERRYDYLEFTDARGAKTRYDTKVGTEKWPKKVTFKAGPRLQFLFHSDSSNNEWGYKFTVTAYGLPDVAVSWGLDLQLLVCRLMGRLASRSMALKSLRELDSEADLAPLKVTSVLNSPLWKPVFRHQMCPEAEPGASETSRGHQDKKEARTSHQDDCRNFLIDFAKSDPAQDFSGQKSELFKGLVQTCRKQTPRTDIVAGSAVDQAVNSTFAALVYLTPALYEKLQKYVNSGGKVPLSDEFAQVYSLADSIRIWMLEMKQKSLMGRGNDTEEKQSTEASEVNPETLAKLCMQKSLLLLNFLPVRTKTKGSTSDSLEAQDGDSAHQYVIDRNQRKSSVVETDSQAAHSSSSGVTRSVSVEGEQTTQSNTKIEQIPDPLQTEEASAFHSKPSENTASQQEDISSPPSTPTRKSQFSRGRLRLLSFRSMEEPRAVPTLKEKYPILKNVLDFIKDQSLSHESVLKVLALRKSQAQNILEVLKTIRQCLDSLGQPHCFHPPCVLFLLELLACQKDFTNYFGNLEGCGAELHKEIRESYYQLVLFLVNSVKGFSAINDRSLLPALSCVQTALLHLLDMSWEPSDLSFFVEIQLPQLLMTTSQENISVHDSVICQWSEEDEIADYKQNCEWMDECQDMMFESWYEKIAQADPEKQRKMHMFVARYCDLLNVDISCDGCDEIAPWHRYRCLQCNDMDLCKTCFLGGVKPEGHEDDHEMVNMEYACDHCQGVIIGRRMNCNVCDDFDLCYGCYSAKKYSDSHLPTHSITVYPMVTIRISDRQRLIQPYVHNYSWLLFAALTLYSADLANGEEVEGEKLDSQVLSHARVLQHQCIQLIGDCLMKAQQGKGLKNLALLCMLPEGESFSENDTASVSPTTDGAPKSHIGDKAGKGKDEKPSTGSFMHSNGQRDTHHEIQAPAGDKVQKHGCESDHKAVSAKKTDVRQDSELSLEDNVSPAVDDCISEDSAQKQAEKVLIPSQEQVFAECSQKRILGLLAAMLPPFKSGSTMSLINLEQILPLMFQVVISNAGHLNETYHLTLGLLGQLILRLKPAEVDAAVTKVLSTKHSLFAAGDVSTVPEGWKTTHLLFSLGAVCLDSRVGLDWASSMADILRSLNASAQWHNVITAFTDHCIKQLPFQLKHTNIFTLLVLVGFPEIHGFKEVQAAFLQSGLLKLLVKKCSKGTGFSKTWLLRDLEILSIMLYSSKKEISSLAEREDTELEEREQDQDVEQSIVGPADVEQNKLDPLEGLDEATKICFLMTHDALNAPLHILRAMYELQMKRTDSFFLEVQKRCNKNQANLKNPCDSFLKESKPVLCDKATEETNPVAQKLITNTESDLQLSYAKQRRTKSSILLHKELDSRSKKAVRDYLYRVNEATAVLYARHVLASLLAEWPDDVAINEEVLDLSGPAHMTYILDMLMQLEEKQLWEKILQKVLLGCNENMLGTMALAACQFMEEPGMAVQVRESKHPYNNNTNFEDKVQIPGAIYLSIKFDSQCNTEEGCDELLMSSSSDFQQDRHSFSGSPQKWNDFELPGDTLYYRFTSDMSNTEWGYKFTVTAGHLGRFQTGFEILKQMLSEERVVPHLPLARIWEWQVGVACRQTGHQRLKAIHLLLKIVQCSAQRDCDLTLLKPLWQLFTHMENNICHDAAKPGILLPLHRALAELFFVTENRVTALRNIAAISLAINYPNKSTSFWNV